MTRDEQLARPPLPRKRVGEALRCPACSCMSWHIGRSSATCANDACEMVVELAGEIEGRSTPLVWLKREDAGDASA